MKVLGIAGSPRKGGNTDVLVRNVLQGVASNGIETELIRLAEHAFSGCTGCEGCRDSFRCIVRDGMQSIYDKLDEADGVVLGSPTYFYNMSSLTKAFIERLYCYDVFDEKDRSVWLSPGDLHGVKYAVTVAVCEQSKAEDMGYTSPAMDRSLQAVGYRITDSLKVLHLFEKGEAEKHQEILREAFLAGEKLGKTLLLAARWKRNTDK